MDAIHTALRDLGLELDGKIEKKEFDRVLSKSNPNFKKAWLEYKKDSEIYVKGNYYINPYQLQYENGGGVEDNFDYGSDLTDETMVKKSLVNGEISCDNLSMILGCTPDYPVQVVGAIKLRKCYLKDSYKID
jgi:hypothetical protein